MRTVKWNPFLLGVCTALGGALLWAGAARADVSSTNPAAIVVFPRLVVDTNSVGGTGRIDTIIQLTNTADHPVNVRCFYVDANGHCSNAPAIICDPGADPAVGPCGPLSRCIPGWQETDFAFRLTTKQPIVWTVGGGLPNLPLSDIPALNGEANSGSIPVSAEDPMIGELKCVEVRDDELPTDANDLKGEATVERVLAPDSIDIQSYNGVGIQAIAGANNNDNTLVLGAEYNACPNILLLDNYFDDAQVLNSLVRTRLTLVPCSEDFNLQAPISSVVQFLVFNEFEQRFSTSRSLSCFFERQLSDIDTRLGPTDDRTSIFNVAVEGTLTGQTLIRGVADSDTTHGHGLLGVAAEFHGGFSDAFTLNQRGARTQLDYIELPVPHPAGE